MLRKLIRIRPALFVLACGLIASAASADIAAAHGATVETDIPWMDGYPVTRNEPELTARMRPTLERVTDGRVVEMAPITGAEDFSEYGKLAPAMFFFVGATPPDEDMNAVASNHSPLFFLDESALQLGTQAMLALVLDFSSN